ncbi:tetratricopeptide repeat protein [Micromonospora chalcea]|uniref:tetratricopeptide repeat protein n=1 Tax=Micromonospora chalcea TaxID=1874 RepID=UPI002378D0A3|nr:tetratricopeptide repeat protein [Micromonospora chalcea]WDQ00113.1 tetratricopeptide repeat protein [Micromonospora chalcea]
MRVRDKSFDGRDNEPMTAGPGVPKYNVTVSGSVGVQVGSHNSQINFITPSYAYATSDRSVTTHNLPSPAVAFGGRDITVLSRLLSDRETGAPPAQVVVHGLGGVGKSEFVNQYARANLDRYQLVWWVTSDSPESIELGLAALTRRLHPTVALADAQGWALGWLQSNAEWLLILDNVEDLTDIASLLGQLAGHGRVLITTRRIPGPQWRLRGLKSLHLDVLDHAASVRLLGELTGLDDPDGAARLAAELGGLPLALKQAAAYIRQRDWMSFDRYHALLRERFEQSLSPQGLGGTDDRSIATVWTVTMSAIAAADAVAAKVMEVLAWFAHEDLPEKVVYPLADDPRDVLDALAVLASYSMITRRSGTISVHPLVQSAARRSIMADGRASAVCETAAWLLLTAAPEDPVNNVAGWPLWATLLPHIIALTEHTSDGYQSITTMALQDRAAVYLQYQGNVGAAITTFARVLADSERILGPEHPQTLTARANLATAYQQAGRTSEAITLFEQLLADSERILGPEHPQTLTARANLATAYQQAGRTSEAITLFEQLLADSERILGPEHPQTLTARANLAVSYQQAGRADDATVIETTVLADRERILGPEHPDTLTARANLAVSFWQAGRTGEAIALFEQVLIDRERLLGPEHPDTLTARANLATAYQQSGRTGEAIALFEQVLIDRERLLGPEHPDTLTTRANLAFSYSQVTRTGEAIALLEQVLADSQRIFGPEHPRTVTARANLALSYHQAGRTGEAVALLEQVLADSQRIYGPEHPDTLTARANLAASYQQSGRTGEAIALLEQVVAERERLLGPEHPQTLIGRANLAASYRQAGRAAPGSTGDGNA